MNSFYSEDELSQIGFQDIGHDVYISKKASIYGAEKMKLGSHIRIDDFCILSGKINLSDYIHISAYTALFGGESGIFVEKYSTISSRCCIYAVSDDYSGKFMTNPMIPDEYRGVEDKKVILEKYSIVGSGCTILPGVIVKEGCSCGAMSLINKETESWTINAGIPARIIKKREKRILDLVQSFEKEMELRNSHA